VEVVLGGLSSLLYGVADFLGGEGAKRAPAASIVLWSGILSFPMLTIVALVAGGDALALDFILGALAGVSGAFGLVLLFAGLGRGRAAAVAPLAAVMGALLPVLVALIDGERPSVVSWLGVLLAIPAIFLCAWVADPGEVRGGGALYGLGAGVGFGGFASIIQFTGDGSNLLPLITARGAMVAVVLVIGGLGLWKLLAFSAVPRGIVAANGVLDVSANVTLLLALRAGSLALAAVAASFYPVVTVVMARVVNEEHLRRRQIIGLALTLGSLAAIALG
jgi:drug/metabolite transporter (DMT)-like permease